MTPRIPVEFDASQGYMILYEDDSDEAEFRVPLTRGREGRDLEEASLLLAVTDGRVTSKLREHLLHHSRVGEGGCQFCKIQGRILAAQGRNRLGEKDRPRPPSTLSVQVRHYSPGWTLAKDEASRRPSTPAKPSMTLAKGNKAPTF